jgi:hypothetical protein
VRGILLESSQQKYTWIVAPFDRTMLNNQPGVLSAVIQIVTGLAIVMVEMPDDLHYLSAQGAVQFKQRLGVRPAPATADLSPQSTACLQGSSRL